MLRFCEKAGNLPIVNHEQKLQSRHRRKPQVSHRYLGQVFSIQTMGGLLKKKPLWDPRHRL